MDQSVTNQFSPSRPVSTNPRSFGLPYSLLTSTPNSVLINQLFNIGNLFVLPFWILMILLPKWSVTKRIMESYVPFVVLAALYLYLLSTAITADSAQALANPQLSDLARLFANENATATGWVHFLVMDLFVGRWIYWEGQRTGVWTVHSLVLCLFAGPLGLLSHILTQWISQRSSASSETDRSTPESSTSGN